MEAIIIAGGGLAGLACGIRLRERGLEVEVHERRRYPLKKVCGEFLSPLGWKRCLELGIETYLTSPPKILKRARFYYNDESYFDFDLEPAAYGLSREALDTALARRFQALGGRLLEDSNIEAMDIDARGRPRASGTARWMGWKGYLKASDGPEDLKELGIVMLPIQGGYCGVSPVEDGRISVCFVAQAPAQPETLLLSHPWLAALAPKIEQHAAIAGFDFSSGSGNQKIGDARRVWPPLVGDGMSRALAAGMALGEGRNSNAAGSALAHQAAKWTHEFMLGASFRRLFGPSLKALPLIPSTIYRLSRG